MKISFYGAKNAAAVYSSLGETRMTKNGLTPESKYNTLHIVATNENGRDLEDLKPVLKAFPNRINPHALDITLDEYETGHESFRVYGVNENCVNINNATLPLLEKIMNFLEKAGKMNTAKNEIDENFEHSNEAVYAFRRHYETGADEEFRALLSEVSKNPQYGIDGASYFSRMLKQDIEKYKLENKQMDEYGKKYFD